MSSDSQTRTFRRYLLRAAALLVLALTGCAAVTNPVADGVPVRLVPPELLAPPAPAGDPLPLNVLRQTPPAEYRLDRGDVLGVYVEGYLGDRNVPLPTHVGPLAQMREQRRQPASAGYPVPVRDDGTIDLPQAGSVSVRGLTVAQAREAVRDLYVRRGLLKPELARVIVNMIEPRLYTVLVFRQEAVSFAGTPESAIPTSKRGSGYEVQLPAYQNDVLHALARTGGLPGTDAADEVLIYRDGFRDDAGRAAVLDRLANPRARTGGGGAPGLGTAVTRIPLRQPPGGPGVRPEDVILGEGDVVVLPARDHEVYFTGGLLPPGVHFLPRDHALDVIEAVSLVRGPLINGAFGGSNLSGTLIQPGLGNPSPALLSVVRRTPNGGQVTIVVDLRTALRDPSERIAVRPGDLLILQDLPGQALARYMSQTFFNVDLYWQAFRGKGGTGIVDVAGPDRLPNRGSVVNFNQQ
jgi:protein involved in polysaccharide export with SLBB domain